MATFAETYKRWNSLNLDKVSAESVEEVAPLISDRQRDQMFSGVDSKGAKIGRYRSSSYAKMKNSMNPLPGLGVPDLRLTGQFYKGIFTEVRGLKVIIDSTDEKAEKLAAQYGNEIFGLNKPTKTEFINKDLRPVFMKHIRKATGL